MKTVYVICEKCASFNRLNCECKECYTSGFICNNCGNFNLYDHKNILEITH